jgi:hypothetical protein
LIATAIQEENNATWKPYKKRSKARSGRLAVSMVRNRWERAARISEESHRDGGAVFIRRFAAGILAMPGPADLPTKSVAMTIAELGQHFQHRELARDDNWRSYSTRRNYEFNLRKWIIPRWGNYELGEVWVYFRFVGDTA